MVMMKLPRCTMLTVGPLSEGWVSIVALNTPCDLEAVSGQLVGLAPDEITDLAPEIFDAFVPKANGVLVKREDV